MQSLRRPFVQLGKAYERFARPGQYLREAELEVAKAFEQVLALIEQEAESIQALIARQWTEDELRLDALRARLQVPAAMEVELREARQLGIADDEFGGLLQLVSSGKVETDHFPRDVSGLCACLREVHDVILRVLAATRDKRHLRRRPGGRRLEKNRIKRAAVSMGQRAVQAAGMIVVNTRVPAYEFASYSWAGAGLGIAVSVARGEWGLRASQT